MIYVKYNKKNHSAEIVDDGSTDSIKWNKIRRVVEDTAQISQINKMNEILVPWWCFLNIRTTFVNALRINSIEFELSNEIKTYLTKAQTHERNYVSPQIDAFPNNEALQRSLTSLGFERILTPHQCRNVRQMLRYPSAATFSVPGAGKTSEALAYYTLKKDKHDKLLVVSPRNAFASWEEEIENCLPNKTLSIVRLQGSDTIERTLETNNDVFLITYQQFYRVDSIIASYLSQNSSFMFLDESHRIKRGYSGVYGSSILSISHLPKNKLIMSGTPLPNAIEDLIPQFTFLYPEIYVNEANVVSRIAPIYVRTTKNELGIKPPIRKEWSFDMNPCQRDLYETIISETKRSLEGMRLSDRMLFNKISKCIVRLIQVNTDPGLLVNTELGNHELLLKAIDEGPGIKINEACYLARHLAEQGQKSIIWTQFVNAVESVADILSDLKAEYIHGGIETDEDEENYESRESVIKRFHDFDDHMVLVANPAACAEGISLHKVCHHAIYIDRNFNAAHYLQSEDRIHRLGLPPEQDTYIHILTCNKSIDSSIGERLELKIRRMGQVLNDRGLTVEPIQMIDESTGLTFEDVEYVKKLIFGE